MKNISFIIILILIHRNILLAQDISVVAGDYDSSMIYHDYNPDTVLPVGPFPIYSSSLYIDLNFDDEVDYEIYNLNATGHVARQYVARIIPYNNNQVNYYRIDSVVSVVGDTTTDYYHIPKPLEYGQKINDSLLFTTLPGYLYRHSVGMGGQTHSIYDWRDLGDRFLGIRMNINDTLFHGWIKLKIATSYNYSQVTIMEYALSQFIETSNIYDNSNNQKIRIYPNPVNTDLNILIPENNNSGSISIIDINGITCKSLRISNSELITINMSNFKSGLYFLKISTNSNIYYSRIIKQ